MLYIAFKKVKKRTEHSAAQEPAATPFRHAKSSLVNTPPKYKETPLWQIATEKCNLQNKSDWAECPFA